MKKKILVQEILSPLFKFLKFIFLVKDIPLQKEEESKAPPLPIPLETAPIERSPEEPVLIQEPVESIILMPVEEAAAAPVIESIVKPKPVPLMIQQKFLSPAQYVKETTKKSGIVLHHTVGGSSNSTLNFWGNTKERVATHFLIERDGTIIQCLPLEDWAFHIFIGSPGNKISKKYKQRGSEYDRSLIGIELCSYGPLTLRNDNFYTIYNNQVDKSKVVKVNYRGSQYWEDYTDEQVESLRKLILDLVPKMVQPFELKNDYTDIFDINNDALNLVPGIYSHTSYRTDKSDCTPTPKLLGMLNSLKK